MRIALLEDDYIISQEMQEYFTDKGYKVTVFKDGEELLDSTKLYDYDLFLLDIDTPKINGYEVLEYLRNSSIYTPVIFVTAKTTIDDLKKGYLLGCNDYLKKPFDIEELELRVEQLLPKKSEFKISGRICFDIENSRIYKDGELLNLSKVEIGIISYLIKNKNSTAAYGELQNSVWDGKDVSEGTIRSVIRNIRNKTETDFIKNIRGLGYQICYEN